MVIQLGVPETYSIKPRITVFGIGGAGGNAVNNMIVNGLSRRRIRRCQHRCPGP